MLPCSSQTENTHSTLRTVVLATYTLETWLADCISWVALLYPQLPAGCDWLLLSAMHFPALDLILFKRAPNWCYTVHYSQEDLCEYPVTSNPRSLRLVLAASHKTLIWLPFDAQQKICCAPNDISKCLGCTMSSRQAFATIQKCCPDLKAGAGDLHMICKSEICARMIPALNSWSRCVAQFHASESRVMPATWTLVFFSCRWVLPSFSADFAWHVSRYFKSLQSMYRLHWPSGTSSFTLLR